MPFQAGGDLCLGFWADALRLGGVDLKRDLPLGGSVLEIGCAEANWLQPMHDLRPDLTLVGIDVRPGPKPWAIQGDVLTYDFQPAQFDAAVLISALEHIGLGAYGDPLNPYGDILTLRRLHQWVKPGGWIYFDVPYGTGDDADGYAPAVLRGFWRYDDVAIARRLCSGYWRERWRQIHRPSHPDGPYISLVLDRNGA